jgi:hypothetical protein
MAEEGERPVLLKDHYIPSTYTSLSCLQFPQVAATHHEIKSSIIQMLPSFFRLSNENPYKHLNEFLKICSTIKMENFSDKALKMRLFPFSLKDTVKYWLNSLEALTRSLHGLGCNKSS